MDRGRGRDVRHSYNDKPESIHSQDVVLTRIRWRRLCYRARLIRRQRLLSIVPETLTVNGGGAETRATKDFEDIDSEGVDVVDASTEVIVNRTEMLVTKINSGRYLVDLAPWGHLE